MSKAPPKRRAAKKTPTRVIPLQSRRAVGKLTVKAPAKHPEPVADGSKKLPSRTVLTIGHSTRAIGEFVELLLAHGVTRVVDVRTVPRSRHNPQFNRDVLPGSLKRAGIRYVHAPSLGGLRHTTKESVNTGWRNASFRGYADYMQTRAFAEAIETLIQWAKTDRLALMCAEAVPWRCHRSLIEDALLVRKVRGEDIMSATRRQPHVLTSFARVKGTQLTYPAFVRRSPTRKKK